MAIQFGGGAPLEKLCKALGITGPVFRLVIDCALDDAAEADRLEVVRVRVLEIDELGRIKTASNV